MMLWWILCRVLKRRRCTFSLLAFRGLHLYKRNPVNIQHRYLKLRTQIGLSVSLVSLVTRDSLAYRSISSQVTWFEWVKMPPPQTLNECLSRSLCSSRSSRYWHPLKLAGVRCGTNFNGCSDQLWAPQILFPRSWLSSKCALIACGSSCASVLWAKHFWNTGWM